MTYRTHFNSQDLSSSLRKLRSDTGCRISIVIVIRDRDTAPDDAEALMLLAELLDGRQPHLSNRGGHCSLHFEAASPIVMTAMHEAILLLEKIAQIFGQDIGDITAVQILNGESTQSTAPSTLPTNASTADANIIQLYPDH